jgi:ABC-type antimicrobial peptide transport system permease subunit
LLDLPEGADPWSLLETPLDGGVVPAMADVNSAMWILKLGLGEELVMQDESGRPLRLRLMGLLDHSIFRSEVLISEKNLLKHFPGRTGASYFLIETEPARAMEISLLLEDNLDSFGFDATTTREKIAGYEAVQNTYLSTFQVLGGLGLLLGTIGLGVVLVRNVIERRGELATLRAFGFRRSRLAWIVLAENAFLLVIGVLIGTLAAVAAVVPSLAGRHPPWPSLAVTLALVLVVGMLSSLAAVVGTLRVPLLPALKAEH